jgi:hypothetical protein
MQSILKPTVFSTSFALIVAAVTLVYMTLGPDGFYTCGLPIQFVTQIPIEGESMRMGFEIHYLRMIIVVLIWFFVGSALQYSYNQLRKPSDV